jgi:hypothetical protein
MSVGRRFRNQRSTDAAIRSRAIVDNNRLTESLVEPLAERPA